MALNGCKTVSASPSVRTCVVCSGPQRPELLQFKPPHANEQKQAGEADLAESGPPGGYDGPATAVPAGLAHTDR